MSTFDNLNDFLPVGELGIITEGCKELGEKVNYYISAWRKERESEHLNSLHFKNYQKDNYIIKAHCSRFGSGEGKGTIDETVRGKDLYIITDVLNHSMTYKMFGVENRMSPDDHFADLKRIIAAVGGKAKRINVIMPFLYESRQHKRNNRESLDSAMALQELAQMGVDNILTFDAHDPRMQAAIPIKGFDNILPIYQFIKAMVRNIDDLKFDKDHVMVISPDEGAMWRAIYYANMLQLDVGMFYKRRDYTTVVNGRNPIVAHEFLGDSVDGKDVIIVDDMISSGESLLDVAKQLKERNARRVIASVTFGLFTNGFDEFDKAYEDGIIDRVLTSNLIYQIPELLEKPYYINVDMSKYIAILIESLNHDQSISLLLDPNEKIKTLLNR